MYYDYNNSDNDKDENSLIPVPEENRDGESETTGKKGVKPPWNFNRKIIAVCLVCALLGGAGGAVSTVFILDGQNIASNTGDSDQTGQTDSVTPDSSFTQTKSSGETLTISQIYDKYCNAIVGISTASTTTNVFGQSATTASTGTGFVISSDGYVLTNNHVISDGGAITVTLYDGNSYTATVVGADSESDIALLKIDAAGLTTVVLGDSSQLEVGESVMTIGNPLGELTYTATGGMISALGREINIDGTPINMLQTDTALNPGNSGGPLFNLKGEVIGIVTAKYSSSSIEGIGFAIPINDAVKVANELKENGYVTGRAYMGISAASVTNEMASYYNVPKGAYIDSVESGSSAEKAGLKAYDVITAIDGTNITSLEELAAAKRNYSAGDTATLTICRNGKTMTVSITFDEEKASSSASSDSGSSSGTDPFGNNGNPFYSDGKAA